MRQDNALRILIAAGASAGHLYPALALAECITSRYPRSVIAFVSARRNGIENAITGYRLFLLSLRPFRGSFKIILAAAYGFLKSFLEVFFIIEKFRPDVVIGFGSYVSFPLLLEAALFKKHTIIHEQNVALGRANKYLSLFVDRIAVSFQESEKIKPKCVFTGNPLRSSLVIENRQDAQRFFGFDEKFTILVVGGSQGSQRINSVFTRAAPWLEKRTDFQCVHITGGRDFLSLQKSYRYTTIKHRVFDFLPQMQWAYSAADLVICRAGAGTITELAYFRKAAIVIPYPYAGGHQVENAHMLAKNKAARVIEEKGLTPISLSEAVISLMDAKAEREKLENNISQFVTLDARERLADLAVNLGS